MNKKDLFIERTPTNLLYFLKKAPMFSELSEKDLIHLLNMAYSISLEKGDILFEERSFGNYAYIIVSGEIEIFTKSGEREIRLALRKKGEVIGEMSLLDGAPRMASARASKKSEVLEIKADQFENLLKTSPTAAQNILHNIILRWRDTESVLRQRETEILEQAKQLKVNNTLLNMEIERRKKSEADMEALLNNQLQFVILINTKLRIVKFNSLANSNSRIIFSREMKEGDRIYEYVTALDRKILRKYFIQALKGKIISIEHNILVKNNFKLWYEFNFIPVYDDTENLLGICITGVDITIRKKVEEKIKEQNIELNRTLVELKSMQSQLIQSEKMASLGTLVAGVAHEINNPINFISISTHNIENELNNFKNFLLELLDEDEKEMVQIFREKFVRFQESVSDIKEGMQRLKTIVTDLKAFSHLDKAEQKKIYLVENIKSTLRIVEAQYKKDVKFVTDFNADPEIECWPAQLNQVFINMLINSCHAIKKKEDELKQSFQGIVNITTSIQKGDFVIGIQDNGCGMNEEVQKKMFEPFFTTKEVGKGTGMGLSISYSIIKKHNGRIEVESIVGEGTIILLYLPLKKNYTKNK
ncbi:MAG: cyclic nucleotide-binding domain-containing protein [Leptospiraceae bacterium]|nr:cyclic nucleotide-binding domain-containing protein [Leptospiraceae bacterium]MCP5494049.1 cyclic nucleotide-binding domain-containing protein [Leptospiraceae bacterium]